MRRIYRRAVSLGVTLLVTALVITLGFGLSGLSVSQLNRATASDQHQRAENLADSALSLAMSRILADTTFGTSPAGTTLQIRHDGDPEGAVGLLTFDPQAALSLGLVCSVNNLNSLKSTSASDGKVVPSAAVRMVAEGRCRGMVRRVEAILHAPPFPYAMAASGQIQSQGSLMIAGVSALTDVSGLFTSSPSTPLPASIAADAPGASSISITGQASVSGDLVAAGAIQLDPASNIQIAGQSRSYAQPVTIPDIPLSSYDPANGSQPFVTLTPGTPLGTNPTLGGLNRYKGNLNIQGDLNLESGLLFVEGNLRISGGIQGTGGVVTTGDLTVSQACSLNSANRLAVLAGGDVSLSGAGKTSFLQGIVYTNGNFSADQVTLVGSLIANGDPQSQQVRLQDTNVVTTPEYQVIDVKPGAASAGQLSFTAEPDGDPSQAYSVTLTQSGSQLTVVGGGKSLTLSYPDANLGNDIINGLKWPTLVMLDFHDGKGYQTFESAGPYLTQVLSTDLGPGPSPSASPSAPGSSVILLDPSQFLKPEDRIRIALWQDL